MAADHEGKLMDSGGGSSSLWAPGSPRLSFSRDFVQSEVFNPSSSASSRRSDSMAEAESSDFDFGMLALLRTAHDPLPADELIHNGKLLPAKNHDQQAQHDSRDPADESINDPGPATHESSSAQQTPQQQQQQVPKSPSSSSRWKDLFSLNFKNRFSSPESLPLNTTSSSSCSASSRSSKLKLLFRNSSSGSSSRRNESAATEPSLGRSASESCCSSNNSSSDHLVDHNAAVDIIRIKSRAADTTSSSAKAGDVKKRQQQQGMIKKIPKSSPSSSVAANPHQQQQRRKALAEMKMGSSRSSITAAASSNSPNYQRINSCSSGSLSFNQSMVGFHSRNSSASSIPGDGAWKIYSERMSNAAASSGQSFKVAEVLHMEVCMGRSSVVSRVTKPFTKKENQKNLGVNKRSKAAAAAAAS